MFFVYWHHMTMYQCCNSTWNLKYVGAYARPNTSLLLSWLPSPATRRWHFIRWSQTQATRGPSTCSQSSVSLQKTSRWSSQQCTSRKSDQCFQATLPPVDSITMAEILVCKYIFRSHFILMKWAFLWLGNNRGRAGDLEDRHRGVRVQSLAGGGHHGKLRKEDPLHLPRVGTAGKLDLNTALLQKWQQASLIMFKFEFCGES